MVSRPLSSTDSRRRKRPTSAQFSENSTANQPVCFSGARPTKMLTGTSRTSRLPSRWCACSSLLSESEWVRLAFFSASSGLNGLAELRRDSAR